MTLAPRGSAAESRRKSEKKTVTSQSSAPFPASASKAGPAPFPLWLLVCERDGSVTLEPSASRLNKLILQQLWLRRSMSADRHKARSCVCLGLCCYGDRNTERRGPNAAPCAVRSLKCGGASAGRGSVGGGRRTLSNKEPPAPRASLLFVRRSSSSPLTSRRRCEAVFI